MNLALKGNYYLYKPKNLERPYHKPDYDITLSALYNLRSKIIIKGDIFVIGNQWALTQVQDSVGAYSLKPKLLNNLVDINLGAEYRYSKMLSFFVNFNNIANMRYYRWERYPSQRFNMMIGLSFVPF
jgi:outer membrane receptor protein involved in Fe transport